MKSGSKRAATTHVVILKNEVTEWPAVLRWLSRRTVQLRLLGETVAEVSASGNTIHLTGRWVSTHPDLRFTLSRSTLVRLIERKTTPSEAVFDGELLVAGAAQDLVQAYDFFLSVVKDLSRSPLLRRAYQDFVGARLKSLRGTLSIRVVDGRQTNQRRRS